MRCARRWLALAVALTCAAGVAGAVLAQALSEEPLRPLPERSGADPVRAALGKRLYFDTRLFARAPGLSCASCHDLTRGGADGKVHAKGAQFNTPSIYNSAYNTSHSWIGRPLAIDSIFAHAGGGGWDEHIAPLADDESLAAAFNDVYGDALNAANARDALDQYLRSLVTPSRLDRYLRGDAGALSDDEKAGYAHFKRYGCVACHQGVNAGGNMFARLGAMRALPGGAGAGRFQLTRREADRGLYRVPSLRNVALTAPYLHDGSAATLDAAVDLMFTYQLGREAPRADKEQIVRFLATMSGERLPPPGAAP